MESILPTQYRLHGGSATVVLGKDYKAYAIVESTYFKLEGNICTPISTNEFPGTIPLALSNGLIVSIGEHDISLKNPQNGSVVRHPYNYSGSDMFIFRMQFANNGILYLSTMLPLRFFSWESGIYQAKLLGILRNPGEAYSLIPYGSKMYMVTYRYAELWLFDPSI